MLRPRYLWCFVLVPVLIGLVLSVAACGGFPEDQQVTKFFQACKMKDNMTLGNIATVKLDPQTEGTVDTFKTVSVAPEQARPRGLTKLAQALKDAQLADEAFSKKKKEYQDTNRDAIDRVLAAERKNAKITGKDVAIQTEWTKWRQETSESAKKVSEARTALNNESEVARLSLPDRDVTEFDGTEFSKVVTTEARVRQAGAVTTKTITLTMQRVVLKGEGGQDIPGKWMITGISTK